MKNFIGAVLVVFGISLTSCATVYYNFWETFGQEKRDLLRSNVAKAKDDQSEVQEDFKNTLEKVRSTYKFDGGSLEKTYDALSSDYESARDKAERLSNRIDKVEEIAEDLFDEWQSEAGEITNKTYRRDSLNKRKASMAKFDGMLTAMRGVENSLEPVLTKLKDQVLYLKHNLNAKALGGFKSEFRKISSEIENLNSEIKKSSQAADEFIKELN